MDVQLFDQIVEHTTTIAGAIIALGGASAVVWHLGRGFHKQVAMPLVASAKGIWASLNELEHVIPIMREIAHEFKPNSGSSLRDVVNRIEDGLTVNKNVARLLLEMSEDAHFETDSDGLCTWVNKAYQQMSGMSFNDCLGVGWINAIDLEDRGYVAIEWEKAILSGTTFEADYGFAHSGRVRCTSSFARDHEGRVVGTVGTIRKINYAS